MNVTTKYLSLGIALLLSLIACGLNNDKTVQQENSKVETQVMNKPKTTKMQNGKQKRTPTI